MPAVTEGVQRCYAGFIRYYGAITPCVVAVFAVYRVVFANDLYDIALKILYVIVSVISYRRIT